MKKRYFLKSTTIFSLLLICCVLSVGAQGIYQLWGNTSYGGRDDRGTLFSVKYDGTGHSIKRTFLADNPGTPGNSESFTVYNNKLYSLVYKGGHMDQGIISEYDPASNAYVKRADLNSIDAELPGSPLVVYNNKLYGVSGGGINNEGKLFSFDPVSGQLTNLYNFSSATGSHPGGLLVYNNRFYGVTSNGGANGDGVLYEFDPANNSYTKKADFNKLTTGYSSNTILTLYNGKFWGTSYRAQAPGSGGFVFSFDPVTNILSGKVDLSAIGASQSTGQLVLLNNRLYGVAAKGGVNDMGAIFQYDPATNALSKEMDFSAGTAQGGLTMLPYNGLLYGISGNGTTAGYLFTYNPATNVYANKVTLGINNVGSSTGKLFAYNNKMYCWSYTGGQNNSGSLNEYDPVANSLVAKLFLGSSDLHYPVGETIYYNHKLYGAAARGGASDQGGIYEYNLATGVYSMKLMLNTASNFGEASAFTIFQDKFYGVTSGDGVADHGNIFEYNPATNIFTILHQFNGVDGSFPGGKLLLYGTKLLGTTNNGGNTDDGTLFEYNLSTGVFAKKVNFDPARGVHPLCGLISYNNRIFGATVIGGVGNRGTIFEYLPQANGLITLANFNGFADSYGPQGSLVAFNNKIYGMTAYGEVNFYAGEIYELDLNNNALTPKIQLSVQEGLHGLGGMTVHNNKLYGMTNVGGSKIYGGVLFEYDPVTNNYSRKLNFDYENGRLPRRNILTKVPAPTAPGSPNSCTNTQTININAANANEWIAFTDAQGRAVAEINANGNILGNTAVRVFVNGGNTRQHGNGEFYLDRNITITPANQPATPVSIRLYIKKTEFDALKATVGSNVNVPADLTIFRNSDFCAATMTAAATQHVSVKSDWGFDYVYTADVNSFSSFYFASKNNIVLPIHLLSFNGKKTGADNLLTWTASCSNAVTFTVEKSNDSQHFTSIGTVTATQQDCNLPFSFTDVAPGNGSAYYRLRIQENNGPLSISNVLVLYRNGMELTGLQVYPNPVGSTAATLRVTAIQKTTAHYRLLDISGKVISIKSIIVQPGVNQIRLLTNGLSKGTYLLEYDDGRLKQTLRFVKQ